uniref:Transposase (putative) gypsy type domain-containing protein n=1 Tax=Tanacetum cinerariifolium TaxID=118510 RepID=A0A699GZP4_TANCI|nr:hypothetical protein [Tanacetum cinerariifolium]
MGMDTIQLENAVSTISQEYMLEFKSEYGIPESLHPELHGPDDPIVEFPEGKVGVYTKFFEFANLRIPISQFLFDILGHYQIHLSQLSMIGAAKVSHFKINCRVLNIIPTLNLFRVFYIPYFNAGWKSFSKRLGKNTPQCYTNPFYSLKNWNNRFFWVDDRAFPTVADWRTSAPKNQMPSVGLYSAADVTILNTRRTPIQKQPEALLCLVGLSRRYFLGDNVYPTFLYDDDRDIDLFTLISAPNPAKVKTRTRPRAAHKVPLLTAIANRVIDMEDMTGVSGSSGTPSTIEKSPLDFSNEDPPSLITKRIGTEERVPDELSQGISSVGNPPYTEVAPKPDLEKETVAMGALVNKRRRKRGPNKAKANAPPRSSRKAVVTEDPDSEKSASFTSMIGSPEISNHQLSKQVSTLQAQVTDEERIKATFEEFKKYEDDRVSSRCAEIDARLDALSIEFDEELYPHMLTAITSCRWVIGHGLRLAIMKCAESTKLRQVFVNVVSAGNAKEGFEVPSSRSAGEVKGCPHRIMSSLFLKSDSGEDASQWIQEILLENAIAANISRAEKKKNCRVVCRTHEVGSAHHVRSDGVPVSVPTVAPQGLAILLADAAT